MEARQKRSRRSGATRSSEPDMAHVHDMLMSSAQASDSDGEPERAVSAAMMMDTDAVSSSGRDGEIAFPVSGSGSGGAVSPTEDRQLTRASNQSINRTLNQPNTYLGC